MRKTNDHLVIFRLGSAGVLALAVVAARAAEEAKPAKVPLVLELPKPRFLGTPANLTSPRLEKPRPGRRPDMVVPPGVRNVALRRPVVASDAAPTLGALSQVTDRDKEGVEGSYVEIGPGPQYFQIDLGQRVAIYAIVVWHYHAQARIYHDVVVQFAVGDLEAPTAPRPDRPARKPAPGTRPVPGLEPGFVSLFDGKTLDGWEGDRSIWSVEDGAITGRTTAETKLKENNFLVWKDQVENFELRLKFRLESGNSGIYYRARKRPAGQTKGDPLVGTQADFDASGRWTGVIMEYLLRDVLAERGQKVVIDETGTKQVVGNVGRPEDLLKAVKPGDWNDYRVIAKGGRVVLEINGATMCELDDRDPKRLVHGWLALQVHVGPPMRVQFKDIYLRRL